MEPAPKKARYNFVPSDPSQEEQHEKQHINLDTNPVLSDIRLSLKQQQEMLSQQHVLLIQIAERIYPQKQQIQLFPLKTMDDLTNADAEADKILHNDLIPYIKSILGKAEIHRSFECLLAKEVIMNCNWDGTNKLFKLSSLKLFNTYIFEAVRNEDMGYREYEDAMKKGFHLAKQHNEEECFHIYSSDSSEVCFPIDSTDSEEEYLMASCAKKKDD